MLVRTLAFALTVLCVLIVAEGPSKLMAQAQSAADSDAKHKINLAGRQRMLTQFMAKAMCFVSLDVDDKEQSNQMWGVHDLFEETLKDLRNGNPAKKLAAEQDAGVLAALAAVARQWEIYGGAVMRGDLETVVRHNVGVLTSMNDAVTLIERKYAGSGKLAPHLAAAMNVSGRQRMLSQKASKEHCLIAAGQDVAGNRAALKASISLFDASLAGLRDGDAAMGLKPAPNAQIVETIKQGEVLWSRLRPLLVLAVEQGEPSQKDVVAVASLNLPVLAAMNEIVELYQSVPD